MAMYTQISSRVPPALVYVYDMDIVLREPLDVVPLTAVSPIKFWVPQPLTAPEVDVVKD